MIYMIYMIYMMSTRLPIISRVRIRDGRFAVGRPTSTLASGFVATHLRVGTVSRACLLRQVLIEAEISIPKADLLLSLLAQSADTPDGVKLWRSEEAARSDHFAFALESAPAVLTREAVLNPCYHQPCDNMSFVDTGMLYAAGAPSRQLLVRQRSA